MGFLEEGTAWANREDYYDRTLDEALRKYMKEVDSLLAFWYYRVKRRARMHNFSSKNVVQLHGSNPYVELTGEEGEFLTSANMDSMIVTII